MKNETISTITAFLTAVQNGDSALFGQLLDTNVTWSQPGNNAVSGLKNGAGEVFAMVGEMYRLSHHKLHLQHFSTVCVNGNKAASLLHWVAGDGNNTLVVDNIDVYTVENGKITHADVFTADAAAEDAYWINKE